MLPLATCFTCFLLLWGILWKLWLPRFMLHCEIFLVVIVIKWLVLVEDACKGIEKRKVMEYNLCQASKNSGDQTKMQVICKPLVYIYMSGVELIVCIWQLTTPDVPRSRRIVESIFEYGTAKHSLVKRLVSFRSRRSKKYGDSQPEGQDWSW